MATSLQRPFFLADIPYTHSSLNLSTMATSPQWPPLHNGNLFRTATSPLWPPLYNGHLSTTATSLERPFFGRTVHTFTLVSTSLQRPPLHNSRLSTKATSLQQPPLHNGHLSTMAIFFGGQSIHSLLFQSLYNGQFSTTATSTTATSLQ